jgi:lysophospholipase L1-like esterase
MKHLHNYILEQTDNKGYSSFSRFFPEQLAVYGRDAMSKTMSHSTAGMYLGFLTTGSKVSFLCKTQGKLSMILPIVRQVKLKVISQMLRKVSLKDFYPKKQKSMMDGIDLVVDGSLLETRRPKKERIEFEFENPNHEKKVVKIYFPAIGSISIKDLEIDGITEELPPKDLMLCLGDSITQGMIASAPSLNYVALLANHLGLNALNQGVGGYTFQKDSLLGLNALASPNLITVAYGTNDWTNKYDYNEIQRDIREYMKALTDIFPKVPIYLITPIWRADINEEVPSRISFTKLSEFIEEEGNRYSNVSVISGLPLVDHDIGLFADSFLHPNARGFAMMSDRIAKLLSR